MIAIYAGRIVEPKTTWALKEAGKKATVLGDGTQSVHLKSFHFYLFFFPWMSSDKRKEAVFIQS